MTKPLVSILIPAYNSSPWVRYAILSACNQTWPNKEIIVVDDGSTDKTLAIAREFERFDVGVKVISQPNRGASAARNTALKASRGDYIQWLDSDDLLDPNKIERQMFYQDWLKLGPRTLLSGAWARFHYCTQRAKFNSTALWEISLTPTEWLYRKLRYNLHMQPSNWLVSRELTEAAGPWDESLTNDDDGEYFARVLRASEGTRFVIESQCFYRTVGFGSLSRLAGEPDKLESLYKSMTRHMDYLLELENSERTRQACVTYIRNWLHEFYPTRMDLAAKLNAILEEFGATAEEPKLSPKYQWLVDTAGWRAGRTAQILAPRFRWSAAIAWDRLLWQIGVP